MRKLFLFMMVSLDGYFEGPDHDLSWHNANNDEFADFANEQTANVGVIIFGHRTYDMMADFWPKPIGEQADATTARLMNETPKIVISKTFTHADWQNASVISHNIKEEILKLKEQPGKDLAVYGSSNLCVSLLEMGLLDELRIMVNPVVIGAGTPLFKGIKQPLKTELLSSRQFKSGNVLLTYKPL